jgi:hypothetical protein
MSDHKASAEVRVSKQGPNGRPVAEVVVSSGISPAALGGVLQQVVTNDRVFTAAGLKPCACKSGLDIHVIERFGDVIKVEA